MTSLTGSAGEDFASIMRALGYRMEKRPPLPPAPPQPAETPATEAAAEATAESPVEATIDAAAAEVTAEAAADITELVQEAVTEAPPLEAVAESKSAEAPRSPMPLKFRWPRPYPKCRWLKRPNRPKQLKFPKHRSPRRPLQRLEPVEPAVAAGSDPALAADTVVAEPELIEVWRPGGRSDDRPKHDRHRPRHGHRPGAAPAAASGEAGEAAKGERPDRGRRDRKPDFRRPRPDAAPAEAGAEVAPAREGRPNEGRPPRERERFQGKGGKDRGIPRTRASRAGGKAARAAATARRGVLVAGATRAGRLDGDGLPQRGYRLDLAALLQVGQQHAAGRGDQPEDREGHPAMGIDHPLRLAAGMAVDLPERGEDRAGRRGRTCGSSPGSTS